MAGTHREDANARRWCQGRSAPLRYAVRGMKLGAQVPAARPVRAGNFFSWWDIFFETFWDTPGWPLARYHLGPACQTVREKKLTSQQDHTVRRNGGSGFGLRRCRLAPTVAF